MRFGLKEENILEIQFIFSHYNQVKKAILYGSRAKGNFANGSDIDIVLLGINIDLTILNQISNEIDDLLLPYSFDISSYESISNPALKEHIDRVGIIFYEQDLHEQK